METLESTATLFGFQKEGASWLASRKTALLADEMGLGKSAQAITACDEVHARRVLVICPAVARRNWLREFETWSIVPRRFSLCLKSIDNPLPTHSVICSFEYATKHADRLKSGFDALIIDEAHYLKSIEAKRTAVVFGKNGIVHTVKRVWLLTGTPAPNHAGELWLILFLFGATKLKYDEFTEKYCTFIDSVYGRQVTGTRHDTHEEFAIILQGIMLRRRKVDVMKGLPPICFSSFVVDAGHVDMERELLLRIDKERDTVEMLMSASDLSDGDKMKALEALAPSISTLRRYVGLQKVEPCAELVAEELASKAYEKIIIFACHRDVVLDLEKRLSQFSPVVVMGGVDEKKRQVAIDRFQNDPSCQVFIGNILAAGTNITLTAAHQVLFIEQDWVPGNNAQAAMRAHRIGQKLPVSVRFVGLEGSFDDRISQILKRKTNELSKIFDNL